MKTQNLQFLRHEYEFEISYQGITYPSLLHAWIASSTEDLMKRIQVKNVRHLDELYRMGNALGWRRPKDVLRELLRVKFLHSNLKYRIVLIEDVILENFQDDEELVRMKKECQEYLKRSGSFR